MSETRQAIDVEPRQCIVLQDRSGDTYIIAIAGVGEDLDGEPIVEFEIWAESGQELVIQRESLGNSTLIVRPKDDGASVECGFRTPSGDPECRGLPRFWYLSRYLFTHHSRETIFLPVFHELLEDYCWAQLETHSKRDRFLVMAFFTIRTVKLLSEVVYVDWECSKVGVRTGLLMLASAIFGITCTAAAKIWRLIGG